MQVIAREHWQLGVALAPAALLTLGSACVSSGKYEKSLAERERIEGKKEDLQKGLRPSTRSAASSSRRKRR
jgi:hypothetical protein